MRDLPHLTGNDRRLINQVAVSQAQLEVGVRYGPRAGRIGRGKEARLIATQAGGATDSLIGSYGISNDQQTGHAMQRTRELQRQAGAFQQLLIVCALLALAAGIGAGLGLIRVLDRHLGRLIAAADRFGAGDLRPLQLREMPDELARLARAFDDMGARLREVVSAVTRGSQQLSAGASDFSAMSEEIAASSGKFPRRWSRSPVRRNIRYRG